MLYLTIPLMPSNISALVNWDIPGSGNGLMPVDYSRIDLLEKLYWILHKNT